MQEVGHDLLGERAIGLRKFASDVEEEDVFAVVELGDDGVHLLQLLVGGTQFASRFVTTRKHGKQEDFRLRLLGADGFDDGGDTFGNAFGGI